MVCKQRCKLIVKPEYAYKHKDCQLKPPRSANISETLQFDITLLEFYSKDDVRVVGPREDIYKVIKQRSDSWETPREPYDVSSTEAASMPELLDIPWPQTPHILL